ncbi:MAG: hypothetical protein IBX55_14585 [Methyloprofundus sp.]|nr:hypothetical protein [Methyloprofundus sp.]
MFISLEISDIIAVLALAVSMVALWQNHRTNQRQKPLLELQLKKEIEEAASQAKANIQARYYSISTANKKLKVSNVGHSSARNVRLTFDEDSGTPLIRDDVESKFPIDVLEPKNSVDLIVVAHLGTPRKHSINVEWDDDFKDGNCKDIILTL